VAKTRSHISSLLSSQYFATLSKAYQTAAKRLLWYIKVSKDLKLSIPHSDASEISLEEYSDSDKGNCQDTQQSNFDNLFWLNNLSIYWCSKKDNSVAISMWKNKYMALILTTKQWSWLMNALEELNMLVTNTVLFGNNKTAIVIAYNKTSLIDPDITTSPVIWDLQMVNLDGIVCFTLNRVKIWLIPELKNLCR
jgi:hypothetical protein